MQLSKSVQALNKSDVQPIALMRENRMRLNPRQIAIALAVTGAAVTTTANAARDTIQIAGSSTVLPFASVVAEEFGNTFPQFKTPVVGSGGSSAGLKQFCQGVGDNTIDVANASRKIKSTEIEACNKAGVKQIQEIKIGYDGIVFASSSSKAAYKLKPYHVFAALAAQLPSKVNWFQTLILTGTKLTNHFLMSLLRLLFLRLTTVRVKFSKKKWLKLVAKRMNTSRA